jgi:hypothetical protein
MDRVKKIACGRWTSTAVTKSGCLYFWGRFDSIVHPMQKIETPSRVIDAGCAEHYFRNRQPRIIYGERGERKTPN